MEWKQRAQRFWKGFLKPFLIMVIVLSSFRSVVADWNDVPTGSMKPTILEGDRILVNKLAYGLKVPFTTWHMVRWDQPEPGEIVIFFSPLDGTRLVKRVVAGPGDTVQMVENQLLINGKRVQYAALDKVSYEGLPPAEQRRSEFASELLGDSAHAVMSTPETRAIRSFGPVTLKNTEGEREYYVMGDNRDNSADSRFIGPIPEHLIVGRSSRVALSLNYDNWYAPRWGRFLAKLD